MPAAKPLSKADILVAMTKTKSNRAAARYMGVSYTHYKMWAKNYDATEEGYNNLFEQHLNQSGKGIPKFLKGHKDFNILDVCEGKISPSHFTPQKIKEKLIVEGHLEEQCTRCGYHERRVLDYRMPLILHFKDKNKKNYQLENLELLCYNCYFLYIAEVLDSKQIEGLEDHREIYQSETDWELDDYTKQRLKELGMNTDEDDDNMGDLMESLIKRM